MLTDPAEVKAIFTAPPDVLRPGEGARVLEPILGSNSVILLDEGAHMAQRKLMLPAFHGERMERLAGLMDAPLELRQGLIGRVLGYGTLVAGPLAVRHVPGARDAVRRTPRD